ncbi:HTH_Tnp_Tc3_2 domain-containing protein [Trichonephila clavipes]|nr:HTH_Tnp_Tc3_2 domain-containing protein [Trichonephila clavipes]
MQFVTGRIIGLKEVGWANRIIARYTGRSDAANSREWKEWVGNLRFYRYDGSSRRRAPGDWEGRLIVTSAVTAPDFSLSTIKRMTCARMSPMTIHRWLIE